MASAVAVRRSTAPVTLIVASTVLLAVCAVWGEAQRKPKTPQFPLSLFAAAKSEDYIDEAACAGCHADIAAEFARSYHAPHIRNSKLPADRRGCQSCHGPGSAHVANIEDPEKVGQYVVRYTKVTPAQATDACMRCHGATMHAAQFRRSAHGRADAGCLTCHTIHHGERTTPDRDAVPSASDLRTALSPTDVRTSNVVRSLKGEETELCGKCHAKEVGEFRHNFHHPVPEGRMVCSDCHDLHPTKASPRRAGRLKGKCTTCHAEMAGPFRFEHDPVAGWTGDGCIECHKPHGSHNPALLNSFSRGLCSQCHTEMTTTHYPGQTCWNSGCHEAVHGSNRDRTLLKR